MLVRVLLSKIADAARLGWIEVELEPLMPWAKVIDLKAPFTSIVLVAEFAAFS